MSLLSGKKVSVTRAVQYFTSGRWGVLKYGCYFKSPSSFLTLSAGRRYTGGINCVRRLKSEQHGQLVHEGKLPDWQLGTNTFEYVYTHARPRARAHARTHTHVHTHTHSHTHTHTHTLTHTHIHACTRTHTHTHSQFIHYFAYCLFQRRLLLTFPVLSSSWEILNLTIATYY